MTFRTFQESCECEACGSDSIGFCERGVRPYRNAIAAFMLHARDMTGQIPHVYFGWTEGNPIWYVLKFIFFGEGDTAPVTHEILRQAEPDQPRRPAVHVGG